MQRSTIQRSTIQRSTKQQRQAGGPLNHRRLGERRIRARRFGADRPAIPVSADDDSSPTDGSIDTTTDETTDASRATASSSLSALRTAGDAALSPRDLYLGAAVVVAALALLWPAAGSPRRAAFGPWERTLRDARNRRGSRTRRPSSRRPGIEVWVDPHSALYYCPGEEQYGTTANAASAASASADGSLPTRQSERLRVTRAGLPRLGGDAASRVSTGDFPTSKSLHTFRRFWTPCLIQMDEVNHDVLGPKVLASRSLLADLLPRITTSAARSTPSRSAESTDPNMRDDFFDVLAVAPARRPMETSSSQTLTSRPSPRRRLINLHLRALAQIVSAGFEAQAELPQFSFCPCSATISTARSTCSALLGMSDSSKGSLRSSSLAL